MERLARLLRLIAEPCVLANRQVDYGNLTGPRCLVGDQRSWRGELGKLMAKSWRCLGGERREHEAIKCTEDM